jgi:predicted nicotinamide N-methyase
VLATDWSAEAVEMAAANAERNGAALDTLVCSWTAPEPLLAGAPWDLVLVSDVLYERRNADLLLDLLPRLTGEVWLADPGRPPAARFLEAAVRTWEIVSTRTPELANGAVHRLRARTGP